MQTSRFGFSLVELAIVLIIVGLVVGGVLKGTELVESARIGGVQRDLNNLRVALGIFQTRFDALPGDIRAADLAVVGAGLGPGGNGDGRLDGAPYDPGGSASEATWAWQHLRAANLYPGIPASATGAYTGSPLVPSALGRGAGYALAGPAMFPRGLWALLGALPVGGVLRPTELRTIDLRTDDGKPDTGAVHGLTVAAPACSTGSGSSAAYNLAAAGTACAAAFQLVK